MSAIQVQGLVKRFKDLVAVDGVDFQVEEGELFGFLGPNGAGKTTTINILCTLVTPTSGQAFIAGYDVVRQRHQVRESIGLVFQDTTLDDYLTARENMEFHAMCYALSSNTARGRIEELLRMVELWDRRDTMVRTFSGGMKRRLELARGLLHHPQVLFLDEPTLGLDPQTRSRIWDYIRDLRGRSNITIFMTTHYMEEAEQCDRIAIIDHGRIVAIDRPGELKRLVGGDVVTLMTTDNETTARILQERFHLEFHLRDGALELQVEHGEEFIPQMVRELGPQVSSVSLHRPTLEDVFLHLTGREIRDGEPDSREQVMARAGGRGGRITR
ncbi:MAG: daunorubicin resistance transporter ATPase subunit [Dehalococcoidia bacterium]|nr:daunorubicin resistance transporter ATPase subunit [Dehalococcoidia bacterium]